MPATPDVDVDATLAGPPLSDVLVSSDDPTLIGESLTSASGTARASGRLTQLLRGELGLTRLSHYVLLDKLGEGGMGVVFAAYDEQLDRKVAIKLLRGEGRGDAQLRLVREAQAMARLSHPNVVQIYEIGELERTDALAFIVMEFIDGLTLAAWRKQQRRSLAELLAVFSAAGRGLAAAHEKGLVHRDFKPDNVMIRADARVVVMDFGLAREGASAGEGASEGPLANEKLGANTSELSVDLTATGALMGTPAYMAPEQFKGATTDAKSDQFSFCVALWEALHGERPFAAPTLAGLSLAVTRGERREPINAEVPTWIQRVLERGLAVEPDARWPGMDALLDALAADPTRRRRWWLAGIASFALVAGALGGAQLLDAQAEAATRAACTQEAQAFEAAWNDERRVELAQRFASAGATSAWTHASKWLDAYTHEWAALRERSCLETRVEQRRDEARHARVAACLDDGRVAAEALTEVWRSSEDRVLMQAAAAAAGLAPVGLCDSEAWLAQRVAPPSDAATAEQVVALRRQLARAEALRLVGEFQASHVNAQAALEGAQALGWKPLVAEAHFVVGELEGELARIADSRASLERASLVATAAVHDLVTLRAAISLTSVVGYELSDHEGGRYWGQLASALLERMGLEGTIYAAALRSSLGDLQWSAGDYESSLASYLEARELYEQTLGPEHPMVARQLNNIGYLHAVRGDHDRALEFYRRSMQLSEAALGPEHTSIGESLTFIGEALRSTGEFEAAVQANERALRVFEVALGPSNARVADALNTLGKSLTDLDRPGHLDQALAAYERALAIIEATLGPDHPMAGTSLNNIAQCHSERGEFEAALAGFARVLKLWQASRGPEHPYVGICRSNIARALLGQGEHHQAIAEAQRSLVIFEAALGPDHPNVARSLIIMGDAHAALDELGPAREAYERSANILAARAGSAAELAGVRFKLAKLYARAGEPAQARSLAELARAEFVGAGERGQKLVAEIDAWLRDLPAP